MCCGCSWLVGDCDCSQCEVPDQSTKGAASPVSKRSLLHILSAAQHSVQMMLRFGSQRNLMETTALAVSTWRRQLADERDWQEHAAMSSMIRNRSESSQGGAAELAFGLDYTDVCGLVSSKVCDLGLDSVWIEGSELTELCTWLWGSMSSSITFDAKHLWANALLSHAESTGGGLTYKQFCNWFWDATLQIQRDLEGTTTGSVEERVLHVMEAMASNVLQATTL